MSDTPNTWNETGGLEWSDINEFVQTACTVLNTIETIDFGLLANGKDLKKEIQETAVAIICKGLNSIITT